MRHTNEEAGEQKVNTLRYFSGGLKTCEGTANIMLFCLHTGTNPGVASDGAGGAKGAV